MDHQTKSYWNNSNFDRPHYLSSKSKSKFDVAVVGGGIAGLTTALYLKQAGKSVLLLEQHSIASGDSGRTTAHITELLDIRYRNIQSDFGKRKARQVITACKFANETIGNWVGKGNIDCDYENVPGYLYTSSKRESEQFKREAEICAEGGLNAHWVKECPLPFEIQGALKIENQAQFHPLKYLFALARQVHGDGSVIIENTRVVKITDGQPCSITTSQGEFTAQQIVVATHTPGLKGIIVQTKIAAYRTYAIASNLKTPPISLGLYWDTEDPYHYIRQHGESWIIGGEDHKTGQDSGLNWHFLNLIEFSKKHFGLEGVSQQWSGQVWESIDGLPFIGKSHGSQNIYLATGFSGNGMTFGTLSGIIISDLILKKENPWGSLFSPSRFEPVSSSFRYISENKDFPVCLIKDRLKIPWNQKDKSVESLRPGEGKVIHRDGKYVAVYRNSHSKISSVSAVCPHLGCLVHFNSIEKSWDCPCHGSRFDSEGNLLNGPATTNLESIEIRSKKLKRKNAA